MAKKKPPEEHENLERWLVSYGDFITLLFATFVVLYALSQVDISQFAKLEDSLKRAFNAPSLLEGSEALLEGQDSIFDANSADSVVAPLMLEYVSQKYEEKSFEEIEDSIEAMAQSGDLHGVDAKITDNGLLITFNDDLLFYSGAATLTEKAMKTLDIVGVLIGEKFAIHQIRVEGHTDNQPINNFVFPSNWELSSARSSSIIRYFIQRFNFLPMIFTAVGYGDTRPIVDNNTTENRAKNRRVEILVLKNKFKNLEHASVNIMTQSKAAQDKFQEARVNKIQSVINSSKELQHLKSLDNKNLSSKKTSQSSSNSKNQANTIQEKDNTLSIKNKAVYEQTKPVQEQTKKDEVKAKPQTLNDDWLNPAKDNKFLQDDINKQFDALGQ